MPDITFISYLTIKNVSEDIQDIILNAQFAQLEPSVILLMLIPVLIVHLDTQHPRMAVTKAHSAQVGNIFKLYILTYCKYICILIIPTIFGALEK